MSLFDNMRVPLRDLTEEERKEIQSRPGYQERLQKHLEELKAWQEQHRKENPDSE